MNKEIKMEGVNLTEITVTAASPDVLGSLMKIITDEAMKLIPEDAIKKVAEELLADKQIVVDTQKDSYGRSSDITYKLSIAVNKALEHKLHTIIEKKLNEIIEDPITTKVIEDVVYLVFDKAIKEYIPKVAANSFTRKLQNNFGYDDTQAGWVESTVRSLQNEINNIAVTLRNKGVM